MQSYAPDATLFSTFGPTHYHSETLLRDKRVSVYVAQSAQRAQHCQLPRCTATLAARVCSPRGKTPVRSACHCCAATASDQRCVRGVCRRIIMMFGCNMGAVEACSDNEALVSDIYVLQLSTWFNGMRVSSEFAQSADNKVAKQYRTDSVTKLPVKRGDGLDMTGRCHKRDSNNGPRRDEDYDVRRLAPDAVPTNWPHDSSSEYSRHKSSVMDAIQVAQYVSVLSGSLRNAVNANNTHDGTREQNT